MEDVKLLLLHELPDDARPCEHRADIFADMAGITAADVSGAAAAASSGRSWWRP